MKKKENGRQFVICIRNDEYPASLERWKVYPVLPDAAAAQHQYLRVIDESGEDYLYPADYFVLIDLPQPVQEAMSQTPALLEKVR